MKVEVNQKSPIEKVLRIEVEPEKYAPHVERIIGRISREVQVPGFRKGKAPKNMIMRKLDSDALKKDLLDEIIPEISREAVKEHNILPLGNPSCDYSRIEFENGRPISFELVIEVKPEFKMEGYKGLILKKKKAKFTIDEMVDMRIESLQKQAGELEPLDEVRPVAEGEYVNVDFESFSEGKPIENGSASAHDMKLDKENFIPGFVAQIIGKKPGDEWEFDITFPEEYPSEELAGKPAVFKFKLHKIMKLNCPALDDEFARTVGDFDSLDEMKNKFREEAEKVIEDMEKGFLQDQIISILTDKVGGLMIPPSMVLHNLEIFLRNLAYQLAMEGKRLEDFLKEQGVSLEEFTRNYYPRGREIAKAELILDNIADQEDIHATDEDINAEVERIAGKTGNNPEEVRKAMAGDGMLDNIKITIRNQKTYDFIIKHAKFVEDTGEAEEAEKSEETESATA